jgi:hypothetical protein
VAAAAGLYLVRVDYGQSGEPADEVAADDD